MIIILGMLYRSNLDNIIVYILYYNYFKECVYYFITFNVSYSYLKLVIDRINGVYYLKNYEKVPIKVYINCISFGLIPSLTI